MALLAAGQIVGHVVLTIAGHGHCNELPPIPMLLAHGVALGVGATLIAACGRLCRAVCTALRRFTTELPRHLASAAATPAVGGDQPMRALLLLAASMSHRGPPVSPVPLT
jgi:hypothetical protein